MTLFLISYKINEDLEFQHCKENEQNTVVEQQLGSNNTALSCGTPVPALVRCSMAVALVWL